MEWGPNARHGEDSSALPVRTTAERWNRIWGHRALLLWVARRNGVDGDGAEDVVQDAMLRAADHPDVADERLQAWLVRVTTRLCMDGHRRRTQEINGWQRLAASASSHEPGPEGEVCERSEAAWIASVAAHVLPPRQAEALRLIAAGYDVHRVARELGVGYRAAESLLARARRNLRIALTAGVSVLAWVLRAPLQIVSDSVSVGIAATSTAAVAVMMVPPVSRPVDQPPSPSIPRSAAAPTATSGVQPDGASSGRASA